MIAKNEDKENKATSPNSAAVEATSPDEELKKGPETAERRASVPEGCKWDYRRLR